MFHAARVSLGALCLLLLSGCDRGRENKQAGKPEPSLARVDNPSSCKDTCSRPMIGPAGVASNRASTVGSVTSETVSRARSQDELEGVPILFSASEGTDPLAADLIDLFGRDKLRVSLIQGLGPRQTLHDLLHRPGVDMAVVEMDSLGSLTARTRRMAQKRLRYIARLYTHDLHVLARRDIADLQQLNGRRVDVGPAGSATWVTAQRVFATLGVKPVLTEFGGSTALDHLRSGEIDAALLIAPRPSRLISDIPPDESLHLLPLPYRGDVAEGYLPGQFEPSDYPNLIRDGRPVHTLAVGTLLAVVNWPKGTKAHGRARRFVHSLYSRFAELQEQGRHPKWKEVSPAAVAPGWQLFQPVEDWLDRYERRSASAAGAISMSASRPHPQDQ